MLFGERNRTRLVPALRDLPLHFHEDGGYDGQYYAQMATDPLLRDPETDRSLDLAPHRARRILFSWTAYVAGAGEPARIVQAYAVQNVIVWCILGVLAFRWFPPTTGRHVALWVAVMYAGGLLWSVRAALLDGPSLLVIALGMLALERGRPWLAAGVFGISGLARETNVIAAAAQLDVKAWTWKSAGQIILQLGLVAAPIAIWFDYLYSLYRSRMYTSGNVMSAPLEWFWWRWQAALSDVLAAGWQAGSRFGLLILVSLSVQALFMFARPQLKNPWWRLGCAYAALMLFFGRPLWESDPGALRVLLPMTFAFNVMLKDVAHPLLFWPLLIAGNVSVLFGLHLMEFPGTRTWL